MGEVDYLFIQSPILLTAIDNGTNNIYIVKLIMKSWIFIGNSGRTQFSTHWDVNEDQKENTQTYQQNGQEFWNYRIACRKDKRKTIQCLGKTITSERKSYCCEGIIEENELRTILRFEHANDS